MKFITSNEVLNAKKKVLHCLELSIFQFMEKVINKRPFHCKMLHKIFAEMPQKHIGPKLDGNTFFFTLSNGIAVI